MNYKYCCVIDTNNYYKTFVIVYLQKNGVTIENVESYILQDGEQLIDALPPSVDFARAIWNGYEWIEDAAGQERKEAQFARKQE